jgi:hypothetical protein
MYSAFKFRSLLLKALNNREQFFVVNLVVTSAELIRFKKYAIRQVLLLVSI